MIDKVCETLYFCIDKPLKENEIMNPVLATLLIPFLGTTLGAAFVFLMKRDMPALTQKILLGFASGVMVAASVWSLIIPAIDMGEGPYAVVPPTIGLLAGFAFLLIIDYITPHIHISGEAEGPQSRLSRTAKLALAVTIHNFPEGMAVGVALAGALSADFNLAGALALALGIAIQNIPEYSQGEHSNIGTIGFALGFALMMVLDVVLG